MIVIYSAMAAPQRYQVLNMTLVVMGMWTITHICAALLYVFVEKPLMNLQVLLMKRVGWMGNGRAGVNSGPPVDSEL